MGEIIPVDFGGNTERLDESSESSLVKNLDRLRSFVESAPLITGLVYKNNRINNKFYGRF